MTAAHDARLADLVGLCADSPHVGVVVWDDNECIIRANAAFAAMVGHTVERIESDRPRLDEFVPEHCHELKDELLRQLSASGSFRPFDISLVDRDGEETSATISGTSVEGGSLGLLLDATDRVVSLRLLEQARERHRVFAHHVPGVTYRYECAGEVFDRENCTLASISPSVEALTGYSTEDIFSEKVTFAAIRHPDHVPRVREQLMAAVAARRPYEFVYPIQHADGRWRWVEERGQAIYEGDRVAYLQGVIFDVTWRKEAEDALRQHKDELESTVAERTRELREAVARLEEEKEFLTNLIDQHETYRQMVASEIHDGPAQYLAAASMRLDAFAERLPDDGGEDSLKQHPLFELSKALVSKALQEIRQQIEGLSPPVLDRFGLVEAAERLLDETPGLPKDATFEHDVAFDRKRRMWETNVYRIVQEALTNVAKHAEAATVRVTMRQIGETLHVEITDDGVGFDPEQTTLRTYGVVGIRRRARIFGGTAEIISAPGQGTRVHVAVPIPSD